MKNIILLLLLTPLLLKAQENPLDIFKPLENDVWVAEGTWGDGSKFKQDISLVFSLDNKIVKVESFGFINTEQTEYGLRNHGIRYFEPKSQKIRFWEFDIMGGLTEGTVESVDKNLIYKYEYDGTFVTEMWIYKDVNSYGFVVGIYNDGEWKQKFLETEFKRKIDKSL